MFLTKKFRKIKRERRKSARNVSNSLRFLVVNAAGLRSKILTFKKVIAELKPSVFFVEETNFKDEEW